MTFRWLFFFCLAILFSETTFASILTQKERTMVSEKLKELPITRDFIWSLLFPKNNRPLLDDDFQNELEGILKTSLLQADTQVTRLTPGLRLELKLDEKIAAFNKQGNISFQIVPSRFGSMKENKKNDTVRLLKNPLYFTHAHNIFVDDAKVSRDVNTVILLFHELSHASFDEMLSKYPENLKSRLKDLLPETAIEKLMSTNKEKLQIDGDLYDLFSERFAFELEYRLDRNISKVMDNWPAFYRFDGVTDDESLGLIDGFVRRYYNIDNPALSGLAVYPLDLLVEKN